MTNNGDFKAKESQHLKNLAFEKIIEQLSVLDERLSSIESGRSPSGGRGTNAVESLRRDISGLKTELAQVNNRAANMRLDRQVRLAVRRLFINDKKRNEAATLKREKARKIAAKKATRNMTVNTPLAIFCGAYPGGTREYGGEFIQKRAEAYNAAGLSTVVVEVSASTKVLVREQIRGVDIVRINPAGLAKLLRLSTIRKICIHSVEKPVWSVIKPYVDQTRTFIWVHGFEARRWQALKFNFTQEQLKTLRPRLNKANADRKETMREVFTHPNVKTIFVSEYMKSVAEDFARVEAKNAHVIHNSISPNDFPYIPKEKQDRKRILWVRTFAAKNYANDISRDVILGLSKKPYFKELTFSIFGAGRDFDEITAPLREFENVKITNRFLSREELREQHQKHGVKLVPSRWDSQGLTCGEAMHSGLVPLTSYVTGLKEFVDKDCAIITPRNNAKTLIAGYDRLYNDPDQYLKLSANAAARAAQQCNPKNTLEREIVLLKK